MTENGVSKRIEVLRGFHEIRFPIFSDERGYFRTWYSDSSIKGLDKVFVCRQSNISYSHNGVVRGIHFGHPSYEQSKIVTCISGTIMDVAVDLRRDSETFGQHSSIEISAETGNSAYISHGLGHAFEVLSETATIVYLLSSEWNPQQEFELNPLDQQLGIQWKNKRPTVSDKDLAAPKFNEYFDLGTFE